MIQFIKNLFGLGEKIDIGELIAKGAKIIDVRSVGEFQGGHLSNSVNIPLDKLRDNLSKLDKSQVIITCCASGMRSASAKSILKSNGFEEVHNGGGWTNLRKFEN
jgi:phage shock protein E